MRYSKLTDEQLNNHFSYLNAEYDTAEAMLDSDSPEVIKEAERDLNYLVKAIREATLEIKRRAKTSDDLSYLPF